MFVSGVTRTSRSSNASSPPDSVLTAWAMMRFASTSRIPFCAICLLHPLDDLVAKRRAGEERRPLHLSLEVVGHLLRADRRLDALHDEVGRRLPAHVAEHLDRRQDDRAGVHLVEPGVLGR